jgi:hypothetical protein
MDREVTTFTGIGGQGVQLAAQVLARAATLEGRYAQSFGIYQTGWFVPTADGPGYLADTMGRTHRFGELKGGAQ